MENENRSLYVDQEGENTFLNYYNDNKNLINGIAIAAVIGVAAFTISRLLSGNSNFISKVENQWSKSGGNDLIAKGRDFANAIRKEVTKII